MECHFSFEIKAPLGLNELEKDFAESELDLYVWKSGYNGKHILRSSDGIVDLDMDPSDTDILNGSGAIKADFDQAKKVITEISRILQLQGFHHKIAVDSESGSETFELKY